jgi:hypothetical protein
MLPTLVLVCGSLVAMAVLTVLATTQIVAMNVAYLGSGMRVPGCQGDDDSVGNEADNVNECCLPWFWYVGPWLPGR